MVKVGTNHYCDQCGKLSDACSCGSAKRQERTPLSRYLPTGAPAIAVDEDGCVRLTAAQFEGLTKRLDRIERLLKEGRAP